MRRDMDEDINWGKLFLKVILIFIVILFIIWLISKFVLKDSNNDNSNSFDKNLDNMYEVAEDYFADLDNLPVDGESVVLTLDEMIEKGLIDTLKDGDTVCSTKSSYAKVSNKSDEYTLKVLLTCGSNSDYISKVILNKKVSSEEEIEEEENEDANVSGTSNETSNSSNSNKGNNTSSNSNTSSTSNSNNETESASVDYTSLEYKFCKIGNVDYYTVIYLNSNDLKVGYETKYTILLTDLGNVGKISVVDDNYFLYRSDFVKYKDRLDSNFSIIGANSSEEVIDNINNFIKYSLKSSYFNYELSDVYLKDGEYYIDINISVSKDSKNGYNYNGNKINYIPVYFSLNYADLDNCVTDTYSNIEKYSSYYVVR